MSALRHFRSSTWGSSAPVSGRSTLDGKRTFAKRYSVLRRHEQRPAAGLLHNLPPRRELQRIGCARRPRQKSHFVIGTYAQNRPLYLELPPAVAESNRSVEWGAIGRG